MRGVFTLSAGMMVCLSAPLMAQKKPNLDGEKILADFAQCAARAAPRETEMVIETVPDSEDEKGQFDLLFQKHGNCMNFGPSIEGQQLAAEVSLGRTSLTSAVAQLANQQRQMTFSRRAFRGAIAVRLYLGSAGLSFPAAPLPASVDRIPVLPTGYLVVRCAAERDPTSADRLVRSKRLSSEEADAARAFAPALNSCARGRGRVDISGTAIHGWAAEVLYKQRLPAATAGSN